MSRKKKFVWPRCVTKILLLDVRIELRRRRPQGSNQRPGFRDLLDLVGRRHQQIAAREDLDVEDLVVRIDDRPRSGVPALEPGQVVLAGDVDALVVERELSVREIPAD